jgi:hypothetical protein
MVANKVSSRLFISIAVAATLAVSVAAAVAGKKFPGPYILSFFHTYGQQTNLQGLTFFHSLIPES